MSCFAAITDGLWVHDDAENALPVDPLNTISDQEAKRLAREIVDLHERHLISLTRKGLLVEMLDDPKPPRASLECAQCHRRVEGTTPTDERWLVFSQGDGSLDTFCPECAEREFSE